MKKIFLLSFMFYYICGFDQSMLEVSYQLDQLAHAFVPTQEQFVSRASFFEDIMGISESMFARAFESNSSSNNLAKNAISFERKNDKQIMLLRGKNGQTFQADYFETVSLKDLRQKVGLIPFTKNSVAHYILLSVIVQKLLKI